MIKSIKKTPMFKLFDVYLTIFEYFFFILVVRVKGHVLATRGMHQIISFKIASSYEFSGS